MTIPKLIEIENEANPTIYKHYYHLSGWQWFVMSQDGLHYYGYVVGLYNELGSFDLPDIVEAGARLNKEFEPIKYRELKKKYPMGGNINDNRT